MVGFCHQQLIAPTIQIKKDFAKHLIALLQHVLQILINIQRSQTLFKQIAEVIIE
jgi:hypothetical protein